MQRRTFIQAGGAMLAAQSLGARAAWSPSAPSIIVGQSAAFSGPAALLGIEMRQGVEAAFVEANKAGGVHGRKLELLARDDGYEPDQAVNNTKRFIEEGVFALLGYVGTPTSNAAMPFFTEAKVPFVGAFTGAASLRTNPVNPMIFNVRASYGNEAENLVNTLVNASSYGGDVGIFYQNDGYGQAVKSAVEAALQKQGMKLSTAATVERNSTDVAQAVAAFTKSKSRQIIMASTYTSCGAFVEAMRKNGVIANYASVSFIGTSGVIKAMGESAKGVTICQVMPNPEDPYMEISQQFQRAMRGSGALGMTYGAMEGYVSGRVFIEGLKRAGKDLTQAKFIAAMEALTMDFGGYKVAFSPQNHNASTYTQLTMIGAKGRIIR